MISFPVSTNTYGLNFSPDGAGNLLVQCSDMYLAPGPSSASLSVTDSVSSLTTGASAGFSILALDPLAGEEKGRRPIIDDPPACR